MYDTGGGGERKKESIIYNLSGFGTRVIFSANSVTLILRVSMAEVSILSHASILAPPLNKILLNPDIGDVQSIYYRILFSTSCPCLRHPPDPTS
jgi:hypothetical protein